MFVVCNYLYNSFCIWQNYNKFQIFYNNSRPIVVCTCSTFETTRNIKKFQLELDYATDAIVRSLLRSVLPLLCLGVRFRFNDLGWPNWKLFVLSRQSRLAVSIERACYVSCRRIDQWTGDKEAVSQPLRKHRGTIITEIKMSLCVKRAFSLHHITIRYSRYRRPNAKSVAFTKWFTTTIIEATLR